MDFVSGALPNIMFIVGMIAIGIALGIEFKIVEVKGQLSKNGRIGAFGIGAALIIASIVLYTRPATTASAPTPAPAAQAALLQSNSGATLLSTDQPTPAPPTATPAPPTATPAPPTATAVPPTATAVPPTATSEPPTATLEPPTATSAPPTATPEPPTATPAPPTAIVIPPTATAVPGVQVPDIRGSSSRDASRKLREVGLELGEKHDRCEQIGMTGDNVRRVKRGQIACQSPAPGSVVAPDTRIDYVSSSDAGGDNGD
jgi:PASTA domain